MWQVNLKNMHLAGSVTNILTLLFSNNNISKLVPCGRFNNYLIISIDLNILMAHLQVPLPI